MEKEEKLHLIGAAIDIWDDFSKELEENYPHLRCVGTLNAITGRCTFKVIFLNTLTSIYEGDSIVYLESGLDALRKNIGEARQAAENTADHLKNHLILLSHSYKMLGKQIKDLKEQIKNTKKISSNHCK